MDAEHKITYKEQNFLKVCNFLGLVSEVIQVSLIPIQDSFLQCRDHQDLGIKYPIPYFLVHVPDTLACE